MRLQRDWCDIRLVVEAAVSCLPADQSAHVSVDCDPDLPAVWADHDRLEQVFVNLLNNAFKHNAPGTRVWVSARDDARTHPFTGVDGTEVRISVIDDGAGFPPALAAAPFDSARRHPTRAAGAGLGLSIARGIVEAHGGQIELAQAPAGTAFRIRLPVEAATPHLESPDLGEHEELTPLAIRSRPDA
jgi:signal transduction histidine kinase